MFTSFNVKYPEYEVITPQTGLSFHVRSLNVQEEEKLKASFLTPTKVTEHLNKCLYDSITKKPEEVTDYDTFLKLVTLKDRDSLLYGLYHITYEEVRNYDVRCATCRREYPVTILASSTFNINPYSDKDVSVLEKRVGVDLPLTSGVKATIRQPTLKDEMIAFQTLGSQPDANSDIITETLIIEKFEQTPEDGNVISYTERGDVVDAYFTLPSRDKRAIYESYRENFGQYGIELKMKSTCAHCSSEDTVSIDLFENFFRMVYSLG